MPDRTSSSLWSTALMSLGGSLRPFDFDAIRPTATWDLGGDLTCDGCIFAISSSVEISLFDVNCLRSKVL